jgi:hypothetical protein
MTKFTVTLMTLFLLAAVPVTYAQQPGQQQQNQVSISGCLEKGSGDAYTLTTQDGQQVSVTGSPDLSKHVGHTVRITGTRDDKSREPSLKASKVELVAPQCSR